jgi:hypothetical protein
MKTLLAIGFAFAVSLLVTGSLNAQRIAGQTINGGEPHTNLAGPATEALISFWGEQYGYRFDSTLQPRLVSPGLNGPFDMELIAKAPRDECFVEIGVHTPILPPNCPEGSVEKANEMYVWGMAIEPLADEGAGGDEVLWFGTGNNTPCLANASLGGLSSPSIDDFLVCEYNESLLVNQLPVWPGGLGDLRPSRMVRGVVDGETGELELTDLTPSIDFIGDFQRFTTGGIRSAGVVDNVVIFAGPALAISGAVNMWAFRTDGQYLGSKGFLDWGNIRKFVTVDGEMYVGVLTSWDNPHPGGSVLRWVGSETDPFQFEEVARLDNEVAELIVHEEMENGVPTKRLVAGTWPRLYGTLNQTDELYGLFRSPPLPLDVDDVDDWDQIFRIDDYEPDPATARAIASGGLASYNGYIWFGTLITVGIPVLAWVEANGIPITEDKIIEVILGTYRPLTFFRGRMVEGEFEVEVLYGNSELPVYNHGAGEFQSQPTGLGAPIEGLGGFNNLFNTYTWSVEVGKDGLMYVGTLDNSFSLQGVKLPGPNPLSVTEGLEEPKFGCDLFVFGPASTRPRPVTLHGFGNETNSGIRNMRAGYSGLYIGTGNVSNITAEGGWELIRVKSPLLQQD